MSILIPQYMNHGIMVNGHLLEKPDDTEALLQAYMEIIWLDGYRNGIIAMKQQIDVETEGNECQGL